MPGSFPGWTWSQLPEESNANNTPSSSRPRFGWIWNGDEAGNVNPEPTPSYATLDVEMAEDPSASSGRGGYGGYGRGGFMGGRGGFGPFRDRFHPHHHHHLHRRHSGSKSGGEEGTDHSTQEDGDEKLKRRSTFHEQRHQMHTRREQLQEGREAILQQREMLERQRNAMIHQRHAMVQQRHDMMEQKREQAQQARQARQAAAPTPSVPAPMGGGSLAGIWPSSPSANTAPAPAQVPAPTPAPASVPMVTSTPGSFPTTEDTYEFMSQIGTLVQMGFPDNTELRTVVRDFGGEMETILDFLLSQNA